MNYDNDELGILIDTYCYHHIGFESIWNLPHCICALEGKHIAMKCPKNTGSLYYNYKGFLSIVLIAGCDTNYNFTLVDIGQYGSNNDSSVLANSDMGKAFEDGTMNLPEPSHFPGYDLPSLPYYLVGLNPWLLRPYPGKNLEEDKMVFNSPIKRDLPGS
jgi:hypothetical protein